MSDTIFDQTGTTPPAGTPAPTDTKLPDELAGLIGEGKKYATVEAALKSVPHAQKHIEQLEREMKELREKAEKAAALDDVYKTVQDMLAQGGKPPAGGLAETDIDVLLDRKLQAREAQQRAKENTALVKNVLVEQFGERAADVYKEKAAALGIGVEFLNDLCGKSPKAALELLGVKSQAKPTGATPPTGSINSAALDLTKQPPKPKPVMGGASTSEVLAAWRAAKPN